MFYAIHICAESNGSEGQRGTGTRDPDQRGGETKVSCRESASSKHQQPEPSAATGNRSYNSLNSTTSLPFFITSTLASQYSKNTGKGAASLLLLQAIVNILCFQQVLFVNSALSILQNSGHHNTHKLLVSLQINMKIILKIFVHMYRNSAESYISM